MTMLKFLLTALTIALQIAPVFAHDDQHVSDWIGESKLRDPITQDECCGPRDCAPVKFGGVLESPAGYYVVELGKMVPSSRVIWKSRDGQWWLCTQWLDSMEELNTGRVTRQLRCLIGPPRSS
jgi:hypothetical protein